MKKYRLFFVMLIITLLLTAFLFACGEKSYTISFDTMGGEELTPITLTSGEVATLPIPNRTGYDFIGWYTTSDYSKKYEPSSQAVSLVLYAKWSHEHSYGEWTVSEAATCEGDGERQRECTVCGEEQREMILALKHDYTVTVLAATCLVGGQTEHTCSVCGDSYISDEIQPLGHTESQWLVAVEANCGVKGSRYKICDVCGDFLYEEELAATDHFYGEWQVFTAADCVTDGMSTRYCDYCNLEETLVLAATGHSYEAHVYPATCTQSGYTDYICSNCFDYYQGDEINALGHRVGLWTLSVSATPDNVGERQKSCTVCSEVLIVEAIEYGIEYTEWTYKEEHTHTRTEIGNDSNTQLEACHCIEIVVAPTCNREGYTVYTCVKCGRTYTDSYVPVLEHAFGEWEIILAATETSVGERRRVCSLCGNTETEEIPMLE